MNKAEELIREIDNKLKWAEEGYGIDLSRERGEIKALLESLQKDKGEETILQKVMIHCKQEYNDLKSKPHPGDRSAAGAYKEVWMLIGELEENQPKEEQEKGCECERTGIPNPKCNLTMCDTPQEKLTMYEAHNTVATNTSSPIEEKETKEEQLSAEEFYKKRSGGLNKVIYVGEKKINVPKLMEEYEEYAKAQQKRTRVEKTGIEEYDELTEKYANGDTTLSELLCDMWNAAFRAGKEEVGEQKGITEPHESRELLEGVCEFITKLRVNSDLSGGEITKEDLKVIDVRIGEAISALPVVEQKTVSEESVRKAEKKIEDVIDYLNSDAFQLTSKNGRLDDLKTVVGQARAAVRNIQPHPNTVTDGKE